MMISNSVTLCLRNDSYGRFNSKFINFSGCSEFVALDAGYVWYITMPLYILCGTTHDSHPWMHKLFGKDYTQMQYMQDYIKFVYDILKPVNGGNEGKYFELVTFKDFKEYHQGVSNTSDFTLQDNKISMNYKADTWGSNTIEFKDEDIIGIKTNCAVIRKMSKASYWEKIDGKMECNLTSTCRKVQLAHTALRLIYSTGYKVALFALKLHKMFPETKPLYCMWLAYHLNYYVRPVGSDYGDWFQIDNSLITEECFVKRFFDPKGNSGVMWHFHNEEDSLLESLGLDTMEINKSKDIGRIFSDDTNLDSVVNAFINFPDRVQKGMDELINQFMDLLNSQLKTIKFKFKEELFCSVAKGAVYDGIEKPKSKLNRIIFRDEDESYLSVLKGSKYIELVEA